LNIKKIIATLSIVVSGLIIYGFILVQQIFADTKFTESQVYIYPTDANYSEVKKLLAPYIDNLERFDMVANKMSYPQNEIRTVLLTKQ
jgi:UPF0755 protein